MPVVSVRRTAVSAGVKVPEITAIFWVIKVLTTGAGEAASDYLASGSLVLAAGIGLLAFAVALLLQLRAPRYVPWIYWSAVSAVAVFGTMAADAVHVVLGIPYPVTTAAYALSVAAAFLVWHRMEGTLDIHTVTPGRREIFYWLTVLATFALGTAVGDLSAFTLRLGYPGVGRPVRRAHRRPGARLVAAASRRRGRVLGRVRPHPAARRHRRRLARQARRESGLGVGDGTVTVVAAVAIVVLVALTAATNRDLRDERALG